MGSKAAVLRSARRLQPAAMNADRQIGARLVPKAAWLEGGLLARSGRSQNERLWNPPRKSGRSRAA